MKLAFFLIGAIVLMVFAAIAASNTPLLTLFGVPWSTWLCAAFSSLFAHWWLGWSISVGSPAQTPPPPPQ